MGESLMPSADSGNDCALIPGVLYFLLNVGNWKIAGSSPSRSDDRSDSMPSIPKDVDFCHPSARRHLGPKYSFDVPDKVAAMTDRAIESMSQAEGAPIDPDVDVIGTPWRRPCGLDVRRTGAATAGEGRLTSGL